MNGRVLVAGVGNVFLGDDGFGVEVVNRIDATRLPAAVDVADYGVRGVHLAYELLERSYDTLIMVDAVPLDGPPGTLAVLDVTGDDDPPAAPILDGHGMHPQAVLETLRRLGGTPGRVRIVGCRPGVVAEGIGLSGPVLAAVDDAVRLTVELAREEAARAKERASA